MYPSFDVITSYVLPPATLTLKSPFELLYTVFLSSDSVSIISIFALFNTSRVSASITFPFNTAFSKVHSSTSLKFSKCPSYFIGLFY